MKIPTQLLAGICILTVLAACDRSFPPAGSVSANPASARESETVHPSLGIQPPAEAPVRQGERDTGSGAVGNRAYVQYAVLDVAPDSLPHATDSSVDTKARKSDAETEAKVNATASLAGNDLNFIQRIGNDGQSEEQAALYVASKTLNSDIRGYAAQIGRDHGKANQQLRKLAAKRGIDIPADPDGALRAKLDSLRQLAGRQMEQAFLQDFGVQAHMDIIALFEVQASQSQDKELKAFAVKQLSMLREHYKQAKALQKKHATVTGRLNM